MSWYIPYIYPIKSPFKNGPLSRSTSWSPGGRWPKCKAPPRCRRAPNPWGKSLVTRPSEPWEILGYPWLSDIFSQSFPLWHGRIDDSNGFNGFNDEIGSIIFLIVLKHLLCDDFTGLSLRHAPSFMAPIWIETGDISGYPLCVSHWRIDPRDIVMFNGEAGKCDILTIWCPNLHRMLGSLNFPKSWLSSRKRDLFDPLPILSRILHLFCSNSLRLWATQLCFCKNSLQD